MRWLRSFPHRLLAIVQSLVRHPGSTQAFKRSGESAVTWILLAHAMSRDGGMPAFYDLLHDFWAPGYPETTGYLIPTLLNYAARYSQESLHSLALAMANELLQVQTTEGAIPGWVTPGPVYVFDTGQVLQGWLAAWQNANDRHLEQALLKAADWLVTQQDSGGYWIRHQFGGHVKVWDVRVGWSLLQVGQALGEPKYVEAGQRCLDWALAQQKEDGWFEHAMLEPGEPPVTHTIAYAIEGLLEGGFLLGQERYTEAARRAADALLAQQRADGSLSAYWAPGWRALSRSCCLPGNAQMALCWLRLYQYTGQTRYLDAGRRALIFVSSTQALDARWPAIRGCIPGSWPIWGRYLSWRYPNWGVKFFLDALLLYDTLTMSKDV